MALPWSRSQGGKSVVSLALHAVPVSKVVRLSLLSHRCGKEILKVPVLGYWLLKARCISLDRENPRDAVRMINEGVKNLKDGYSMVIFPEGTRSKDGKPLPFKKGSVKLGTKAKAPIVPVTIDAAFLSFEKDKKFKPSTITVTFGKAIDTKNLTKEEEKSLTDNIRETIVSNLRDEFKA